MISIWAYFILFHKRVSVALYLLKFLSTNSACGKTYFPLSDWTESHFGGTVVAGVASIVMGNLWLHGGVRPLLAANEGRKHSHTVFLPWRICQKVCIWITLSQKQMLPSKIDSRPLWAKQEACRTDTYAFKYFGNLKKIIMFLYLLNCLFFKPLRYLIICATVIQDDYNLWSEKLNCIFATFSYLQSELAAYPVLWPLCLIFMSQLSKKVMRHQCIVHGEAIEFSTGIIRCSIFLTEKTQNIPCWKHPFYLVIWSRVSENLCISSIVSPLLCQLVALMVFFEGSHLCH